MKIPTLSILIVISALATSALAQTDLASPDLGSTVAGTGKPSDDKGVWPQFRGPRRDGIAHDARNLPRSWSAGQPKVLWQIKMLGIGYSAPSVYGGMAYFNDYDENNNWMVRCVSLDDGAEIWRWSYRRVIRPNHAITRTVPATDGKYVFSFDPKCVLHCLDAKTGKRIWGANIPADFGVQIPAWYNGQCPLIEDDRIILGLGGQKALMVAFDKATGKVLWRTPNPDKHQMTHSSVMATTVNGVKQYVYCTFQAIVGVRADDGKLLWELPWTTKVAVAPSPTPIGDGRVFMTSGYNVGALMLKIEPDGDGFKVTKLYEIAAEDFESDCHTMVLYKDHLFGVDKNGYLTCLSLDGKIVWKHEGDYKFGLGNWLLADGMLFVIEGDTGMLRLVEADPAGYKPLAEAKLLSGGDVWAPMTYFDGKLIIRDLNKMLCIQVAE